MGINKDINKNLRELLSTTQKPSSNISPLTNIDTLQSKEFLEKRELEKREFEKREQAKSNNTNTNNKDSNSSSVFSVRIKNKDIARLKHALERQGINNFSTGLRTIIYKYMQDNNIL